MPSITVRDIPPETHAELTARAALAGQSLQEYLKAHLIALAGKPDVNALMARVHEWKERAGTHLPAKKILGYRDVDRR
jgi:hypothetical protein